MQQQAQQQFYPGSFGITKQDLVALKSSTAATPNMKMQIIRLFECLRSTVDCFSSMAIAPTREEVCMRKGGHIVRASKKKSTDAPCCHECGKAIITSSELRHDEEVQIQFHKNVRYWTAETQINSSETNDYYAFR
ncbi:MAG TPA: hypothetical protein V6C81_06080 [Planktothrix sp.]|jgi:hypothetical protein